MVPFAFIKDGELAGIDIAIFAQFCKEKGYGIEAVEMDFAGIIPVVSSGKCDLACGGVAYTEERAESVYFSEPSYEGWSMIAVMKNPQKHFKEKTDAQFAFEYQEQSGRMNLREILSAPH